MRLLIVSNRLPIKIEEINGEFEFSRSSGGLATGLSSLNLDIEKHWIGWPGIFPENQEKCNVISEMLNKDNIHPVFLTQEHLENYYEGYSNSTLWPLCHYFFVYVEFQEKYWKSYLDANQLFLEKILSFAQSDDLIWIQDYQLMLLPEMVRKELPDSSIGYFHHIPFPSHELFRIVPERANLLNGLLGADLIGFHTNDYTRHFENSVFRILSLKSQHNQVSILNRIVNIDYFPMGINYDLYYNSSDNIEIQEIIKSYTKQFKNKKIILSVDRLDYSKGIINRLKAFSDFLEKFPEYLEKVSLVIVLVPSRDNVEMYQSLKVKIDETVGSINGKYSSINWNPIHYFYKGIPFNELTALYYIADIALVTPLRDGMNLVAKEYIATKKNKNGVLVLSEMAGAAIEMVDAIIINPNNICEIENAIYEALEMPETEQIERIEKMQEILKKQTVQKWANDFINNLMSIKEKNTSIKNKILHYKDFEKIKEKFLKSKKRLFLLDYDGTLVSYYNNPKKSFPSNELKNLLIQLSQTKNTDIVIISGRDIKTLESWLGDLPVQLVAEHGAYYKEEQYWVKNFIPKENWKEEILQIMQEITDKTPGSFIESKETAIVWHYRKTDVWIADIRVNQLIDLLIQPCSKLNLQILRGNKIIEVKLQGINKGIITKSKISNKKYDFILSAGDDTTDEDMFREVPADSISIKIGQISEFANYNLPDSNEFLKLLKQLIAI